MSQLAYLSFWGKAGGAICDEPLWHPVAYHSLDVAAVADALLTVNPRKLGVMADLLGTSPHNARRFLVCLIALHDVGKFSKFFQAKNPEAWALSIETHLGPCPQPPKGSGRHDADAYLMRDGIELRASLKPATRDWSNGDFNTIWAAITGHHGQPRNDNGAPTDHIPGIMPKCMDAAKLFSCDVCALFQPLDRLPLPDERSLSVLSWLVCGLTVVSDWIGSNRDWFPYCAPCQSLAQYWDYTRAIGADAIVKAGVLPSRLSADMSAARLLSGRIAASLSPLQQRVSDMPLPEGPMLTIIEDVTGSGKTEAAILLAARLMADGHASGLFFALPTMATANAMYDRLVKSYGRLFADAANPSLVLGHGKRMLNEKFTESILDAGKAAEGYPGGGGATCAAWIADDRRKVFLAEIGIGTIDQALLGVLPSRHQVLRLWGLSDRVLIIDEAHAYDAYMAQEMERQLEFQAALGGSAIVLSATLADKQRARLEAAFARGLGVKHGRQPASAYPLLTCVARAGISIDPLPSRQDRTRALPVRRIASFGDAAGHLSAMAARGCAVAWIRNSVDDAMEAAAELRQRGHDPVLLHARFAMGDRLDIEKTVCGTLGCDEKSGKRRGFVIVGTQILEQSLDYDVDAMVIDLAPIDLMIQRAGRLWRHTEREGRPVGEPELCVFSPDPAQVADRDWYRQMSKRAAAVYGHHGLIWRSAKALFERGAIETPGGVRELVESVYGLSADDLGDVPERLQQASRQAMGKDGAARSFANANLLNVRDGYGGQPQLWTPDTITPTRLGDPVTVFRLGKIQGGAVVPYYPDQNPARAWALSEVSISQRRATVHRHAILTPLSG